MLVEAEFGYACNNSTDTDPPRDWCCRALHTRTMAQTCRSLQLMAMRGRTANLDERQRRRYDGSQTRIPADLIGGASLQSAMSGQVQ